MKHKFFIESGNFVGIKRLFFDRRYEQRELSTLKEIKRHGLCSGIIELKDKYFRRIDENGVKKEYLYIVTDFLPYTISDLRVMPTTYGGCNSF